MRRRVVLLSVAVLGFAGALRAQQDPTPKNYAEITLLQDRLQMTRALGAILDHPKLTDADRDLLRKAIKPMEEAMAALQKDAEGTPTMEAVMEHQQKVNTSAQESMKLIGERSDFKWIMNHAQYLLQIQERMMRQKPGDLAKLIAAAGAGEEQQAAAMKLLNQYSADAAQADKDAAIMAQKNDVKGRMAQMAAMSDKTLVVIKAINALLTPEQQLYVEWDTVKAMTNDKDPAFHILGFAAQPAIYQAPVAGTYVLKLVTSEGGVADKEINSIVLKKGDKIGFAKTEKGTTAPAGEKTFDVPADGESKTYWQWKPE